VRFVDSHLHLEGPETGSLLDFAISNGALLMICGVDSLTSMRALELAAANPQHARAFVGVHPSEAAKEAGLGWLSEGLERATGLGEVGLDPKYSATGSRSTQLKALEAQLSAVERMRKPVQVHSRGAERECLDALARFDLTSVLMHWFQAEDELELVMDRGYFVSFGPSLVYSKKLQRMAAKCDRGLVMVETDFPVSFAPLGGARGSWLVPSVLFKLADVWGVDFEQTRETVCQNSLRFLGASEKG